MVAERRQNAESGTDKFLDLIADPFQAEVCTDARCASSPAY